MTQNKQPYVPRLNIDLTHILHNKLQKYIPFGSMRPLVTTLLQQVVDVIDELGEEHATIVIGAIISKKINIIDILKNKGG